MTDISETIARMREYDVLDDDATILVPVTDLRALLDHIDKLEEAAKDRTNLLSVIRARDDAIARAEAAEAEFARLRAPVTDGDVGEVVKDLKGASEDLTRRAFSDRCGSPQCAISSNVADRAADLIQRLAAENARLRAPVEGEVVYLCDRLRGIYRIPITDGLGAVGGGEEPDNPDQFVRKFETPPIQHTAADLLQRLAGQVAEANARAETERQIAEAVELRVTHQDHLLEERRQRISDLIREGLGEIGKREAVEAQLREAVEVIRWYEDPWERQIEMGRKPGSDDWESVPDFYDETDFGERARAFLANQKDHSNGQ